AKSNITNVSQSRIHLRSSARRRLTQDASRRPDFIGEKKMRAVLSALWSSSFLAATSVLLPLDLAQAAQSQITFAKVHADFHLLADGTYDEVDHVEAIVKTEAAARQAGQATYAY